MATNVRLTELLGCGEQIKARSRPGTSLADHFFAKFGRGTPACQAAQRAFAESMAAYSLVCYFLQIKVRADAFANTQSSVEWGGACLVSCLPAAAICLLGLALWLPGRVCDE